MSASDLSVYITDRIKQCLEIALTHKDITLTEEQRKLFAAHTTKKSKEISLDVIKELSAVFVAAKAKETGASKYVWLHEIMAGSEIVFPPPFEGPKRSVEQEKLLKQAQLVVDNRQYNRMVRSVTSAKEEQEAEQRKDIKQANSAMSLGFNVIVTMATMFVAGWFLARNAFGGDVAGVIGGLVCSIAAMLVEMWLFVIRGSRLDSQDEKKAKRLAELQKRRPVLSGYGTPPSKSVTQNSPNFTF